MLETSVNTRELISAMHWARWRITFRGSSRGSAITDGDMREHGEQSNEEFNVFGFCSLKLRKLQHPLKLSL